MKFSISKKQFNKLGKQANSSINLSKEGVKGIVKDGEASVEVSVPDEHVDKFKKAVMMGKGLRLHRHMLEHDEGGSLKSIGNTFKKAVSKTKKAVNQSVKSVEDSASKVKKGFNQTTQKAEDYVNKNAGDYVETAKEYMPKSLVKTGLTSAATAGLVGLSVATGQPGIAVVGAPLVNSAINAGVNSVYAHDFSKKGDYKKALKKGVIEEAQSVAMKKAKEGATYQKRALDGQRTEFYQEGGSIMKGISQAFTGQTAYTSPVLQVLKKQGDQIITGINIVRNPLAKSTMNAMNFVSNNEVKKRMKKNDLETLYHLQMDIYLSNGKVVTAEKTEIVSLTMGRTNKSVQEEKEVVSPIPEGLTLKTLMDNCRESMGAKFFPYDAKSNNCQDFLLALLKSSNIGGADDYEFIKQPTRKLFKGQKTLKNVAKMVTDVQAKTNLMVNGVGKGLKGGEISAAPPQSDSNPVFRGLNNVVNWDSLGIRHHAQPIGNGLMDSDGLKGHGLRGEGLRGEGLKGSSVRPVKGSQQAKEWGARMKAMRDAKRGK